MSKVKEAIEAREAAKRPPEPEPEVKPRRKRKEPEERSWIEASVEESWPEQD